MLHGQAQYFLAIAALTGAMLCGVIMTPQNAMAAGSEPTDTTVDCSKKINAKKPECKKDQQSNLSDDQIYNSAYWLAQSGRYGEALSQLKLAKDKNNPRILNYMGFTTRKLGRVDEALTYYKRALTVNPDYTLARAYMGEAFLQQGKLALAREQLSEIEKDAENLALRFQSCTTKSSVLKKKTISRSQSQKHG